MLHINIHINEFKHVNLYILDLTIRIHVLMSDYGKFYTYSGETICPPKLPHKVSPYTVCKGIKP